MSNKPGILITLEGGEGGGKTTQIPRLKERLEAAGYDVIAVREPGGTNVSEQIREVVLSTKNKGISFTTEVLLFQASRAQIYEEVVVPALKAGKVVLMDRSRDSSIVYQGVVRGFGKDLITQLNDISTQKTYPDLTILFDVSPEIGLKRQQENGEVQRFELEDMQFHHQVRDAYLELAKDNDRGRWRVINAEQDMDRVSDEVWNEVEKVLVTK